MSENLKEFFGFLLCFIIFVFIYEHFDFYNNIFNELLFKNSRKIIQSSQITKFKNYSVLNIPAAVYKGSDYSRIWMNLLNAKKKVVFYVKDEDNTLYNRRITKLLNSDFFIDKYIVYDFKPSSYKSYKKGIYSVKKICNTLQECNQQRKDASNYTEMVYFFDKCSKTMCIFNPPQKQYVILRNRNYQETLNAISNLADW